MLTEETKPLEIAARVLKKETLALLSRDPFNRFGWAILDRWAMNNPDALQALERQGRVALYDRLLTQQRAEQAVLSASAAELTRGTTEAEILKTYQVPTEL